MTRVIFQYSEPANEYYIVTFMGLDYNIHGGTDRYKIRIVSRTFYISLSNLGFVILYSRLFTNLELDFISPFMVSSQYLIII